MPPLLLDQISDKLRWYDSTLNFLSPRKLDVSERHECPRREY